MRVVVTGGAGFLGSHLCVRLLADGNEVIAVDDLSTGHAANVEHLLSDGRFALVQADVSRWEYVTELPRADWILHLASPASPVAYREMPIHTLRAGSLGTFAMLEHAVRDGANFLLASTSEVYGDPLVHPQPESYWGNVNPVGWRSCYDEAKRFAEALTMAYVWERGVDARIARIFNTFGPRMRLDDGRPMTTFAVAALTGTPIPVQGDGLQTRSFCYVGDTVEALVRLMTLGDEYPTNIGATRETTILEIAQLVQAAVQDSAGCTSRIEFVERVEDDPQRRRPDTARAREMLGWEPVVSLEEGIRRTVGWVREELRLGREGRSSRSSALLRRGCSAG